MYKKDRLKCETNFQCQKEPSSWKLFMECKHNGFVKIIPLQKSFRRPFAKELASRISDKYFKADETFESIDLFFIISPSTTTKLQTQICIRVCALTHSLIFVKRGSCSPFSSLNCLPFFFFPLCLQELGSFSPSQWLLEKASFLTWGYILAIHLNTALQ